MIDLTGVRAVVFDKDGVLADSESLNLRSAFEVFRRRGFELDRADERTIVGKHPIHYVPQFSRRFDLDEREQRRIIDEQDGIYTRLWQEQGRLFDGVRETLGAVRRLGHAVGLATSSGRREVDAFLAHFELASFFDLTLTLDDVTRAKPDPEIYLAAAERLRVAPPEMLVVEDSEPGIRAAKGSGALCIAVRSPHVDSEHAALADARIDTLGELLPLLGETDSVKPKT
jgi:HAD superfamily hydrolase (TIGR01509 family)